jgi:hypothetical protein
MLQRMEDDDDYDVDRYDSAIGWEPEEPKLPKPPKGSGEQAFHEPSPFVVTPGGVAGGPPRSEPLPLFGDYWREGEVAVLFAEAGTGKSILATQIAELIARGTVYPLPGRKPLPGRRVLYFDLERPDALFRELYSTRLPSGRLWNYRFSKRFLRSAFDPFFSPATAGKRGLGVYTQNAILAELEAEPARIFIIDDISYFAANRNAARALKTIKYFAGRRRLSVLLLAHGRVRRRLGPVTLADLTGGPGIAEIADTIFALGRSTLGPDIRYLRHLKSSMRPLVAETPVFRIGKFPGPHFEHQLPRSPGPETAVAVVPSSGPIIAAPSPLLLHSPAADERPAFLSGDRRTGPEGFTGLEFLGLSEPASLTHDHEAEALAALRAEALAERRLRRRIRTSAKTALAEGILNGSFTRYLTGK